MMFTHISYNCMVLTVLYGQGNEQGHSLQSGTFLHCIKLKSVQLEGNFWHMDTIKIYKMEIT